MEDWSMLVGSGCALVAIAAESTALYDSRIPLVVLHEIFETVGFSGISLDALHDTLTADGAVVRISLFMQEFGSERKTPRLCI